MEGLSGAIQSKSIQNEKDEAEKVRGHGKLYDDNEIMELIYLGKSWFTKDPDTMVLRKVLSNCLGNEKGVVK